MAAPAFGTAGTQVQTTASTMNVDVPDSVAAGDIIVVTVFIETTGGDATVTGLATDFAQAPDSPVTVSGGNNHKTYVMWKRATGADSTAGTYDFTLSASKYHNAQAIRYTGAISSGDPWDVTNAAESGAISGTVTPAVSDTTTVADTLLIWSGTNWSGGTWTPPTSFTERRDTGDGVCTVADLAQAAAGATGSITGTCTSSDRRTAWLGALKSEAVAVDSSSYSPAKLPGRIGPDGRVFTPNQRFDSNGAAAPLSAGADPATLVLSGVDPALAGSGAGSVNADTATLVLTGIDATLAGTGAGSVTADVAVFTFTGIEVTASAGATNIDADPATLVLSGVDPTFNGTGAASVTSDVAALILSGVDLSFAGSGAATTTVDVAVLVLSGVDVTITAETSANADTAILALSGVTPT